MKCFFLYFFIFSSFSKARKAVKGLPNRECSYTELTLIEVSDAFFCPQITQMDTNSFSDRFFRIAQIVGASVAPAMRDVLLISHRRLRRQ